MESQWVLLLWVYLHLYFHVIKCYLITLRQKKHILMLSVERGTTSLFLDSSLDPFSSLLCTFVIQHLQCMTFDPVSFLRRLFWSLERFPHTHTHLLASCGRPGPLGATRKNSFGTRVVQFD